MDAPQLPDAEASAIPPAGPAATGQASAFRRALDKQAVAEDPGNALVPTGAHDLTMPLDVTAVRAALAIGPFGDAQGGVQIPTQFPVPLPAVRTPTVIQRPDSQPASAEPPDPPEETSGRPEGGRRLPARLPTAVWLSALLAALAGAALIVIDHGHNGDPLAPTALPANAISLAASPQATHSVSPTPARTPSPHTSRTPPPSKSAAASAGAATGTASSGSTGSGQQAASMGQGSTGVIVVDVQRRLSDLGLLNVSPDGSTYRDSSWTLWEVQQERGPSPDIRGYYGKATDYAIMAFKRHFFYGDQGAVPPGGCDAQTYAKLWQETAGYTN